MIALTAPKHAGLSSPTATDARSPSSTHSDMYGSSPLSSPLPVTVIGSASHQSIFDLMIEQQTKTETTHVHSHTDATSHTVSITQTTTQTTKKTFLASFKQLYASLKISCLPTSSVPSDGGDGGGDGNVKDCEKMLSSPRTQRMMSGSESEMGSIHSLRQARSPRPAAQRMSMSMTRPKSKSKSRSRYTSRNHSLHSSLNRGEPSSPSSFSMSAFNSVLHEEQMEMDEMLVLDTIDMSSDDGETEAEIDLVVLNASPLVFIDGQARSITPVSHLDADGEKQQLSAVIRKTSAPVHCTFHALTLENLSEELLTSPNILHISGHGLYHSGEYCLALEHDNGSVSLLTMESLRKLLSSMPMPQLVILLACHSEEAAQVFVNAGCPHVIAVRSSERVLDRSARHFSKIFYSALFAGHSIQRSFDIAVSNVSVVFEQKAMGGASNSVGNLSQSSSTSNLPTPLPPPPFQSQSQVQPSLARSQSLPSTVMESEKFLLSGATTNHDYAFFTRKYPRVRSPMQRASSGSSTNSVQSPTSSRNYYAAEYSANKHSRSHSHNQSNYNVAFHHRENGATTSPSLKAHHSLGLHHFTLSDAADTFPSPLHSNLPSRPNTIIGREIEVQRCVSGLLQHRLVHLHGLPKIGKSSVALLSAHYLRDRSKIDCIYYISFAGFDPRDETKLVRHLCHVLMLDSIEHWHIKSLRQVWQTIRDYEILLLLDDCNNQLSMEFIQSALKYTHRCKFISVSNSEARSMLGSCGVSFSQIEIGPLSVNYSIALMRRLCAEGGWLMKTEEMIAFAQLCQFNAWEMTVRMRHVKQRQHNHAHTCTAPPASSPSHSHSTSASSQYHTQSPSSAEHEHKHSPVSNEAAGTSVSTGDGDEEEANSAAVPVSVDTAASDAPRSRALSIADLLRTFDPMVALAS